MILDDLMLPRELPPSAESVHAAGATPPCPPDPAETPGTPEHFNRRLAHLKLRALDFLEHLLNAPEEMITSKGAAVRRQAASAILRVQPQKVAPPPTAAPLPPSGRSQPARDVSPGEDQARRADANAAMHAEAHVPQCDPTAPGQASSAARPQRLGSSRPRPSAHAPIDRPDPGAPRAPRRRRRSPNTPEDLSP